MADVLVTRLWCLLAGLYGLTIAAGVATASRPADLVTGGLLVAASVAAARSRAGMAALAGVAWWAAAGPAPSTMTVMVGWVSTALVLFEGADLALVLRVQLVVVYGFAAANKAVSVRFMDGDVIRELVGWAPFPRVLAVATIAAEAGLAVAAWLRWRHLVPAIIAFHVPLIVFASQNVGHVGTLAVYAGMMVWLGRLDQSDAEQARIVREGVGAIGGVAGDTQGEQFAIGGS